jgi:hypothetical protein
MKKNDQLQECYLNKTIKLMISIDRKWIRSCSKWDKLTLAVFHLLLLLFSLLLLLFLLL